MSQLKPCEWHRTLPPRRWEADGDQQLRDRGRECWRKRLRDCSLHPLKDVRMSYVHARVLRVPRAHSARREQTILLSRPDRPASQHPPLIGSTALQLILSAPGLLSFSCKPVLALWAALLVRRILYGLPRITRRISRSASRNLMASRSSALLFERARPISILIRPARV